MSRAKKTRIGRPPLPRGEQKAFLLSVRFSEDDRHALERAAAKTGESLSAWARRTLLAAVGVEVEC